MSAKRYVYTTVPGAEVRIDTHGVATNDTPAVVPDKVGDELDGLPEFVVALEPRAPRSAGVVTGPTVAVVGDGAAAEIAVPVAPKKPAKDKEK
jgi:hypothetical protein